MISTENQTTKVSVNDITYAQSQHKTLFFYSNQCEYCQQVFPLVYSENLLKNNIYFINLNANRQLIKKLNINNVPMITNDKGCYIGTDYHQILKLIN